MNIALLLDLIAFHFIAVGTRARRAELTAIFEAVGLLDVALSIASVRTEWGGQGCVPSLQRAPRAMSAIAVRHPLVAPAVPNDVAVAGRSWVITGSNMSGKSTFLRAVGVNAVLAGTIQTCRAVQWGAPPFRVRTFIGRSDSLQDGTSYFMAEIKAVQELLAASEHGVPTLFIIDELFRGTNTVERIAAGRAVLEALDGGSSVVLVATHDMELQQFLSASFDSWHFAERVVDGRLVFDHRLREGPVTTRNAIALLRQAGVAAAIVQRAEQTTHEVYRE